MKKKRSKPTKKELALDALWKLTDHAITMDYLVRSPLGGSHQWWKKTLESHYRLVLEYIEGKKMKKKTKPTRGCNLCAAHFSLSKRGLLKEPHDCLICGTSYKPKKKLMEEQE